MKKYSIKSGTSGKYLGRHILVEYFNCDTRVLDSVKQIKKIMHEAAKKAGATIVCESFHHFSPWGVSGVVVIMESHFSIHTWPEYDYAAVDFFTCGNTVRYQQALAHIKKMLKAKKQEVNKVQRGLIKKINNITDTKIKNKNH